ncbi:MAG: hydrogenase [Bacteroidales bacterium]|nr:hydrogenase [Bacteroidales bacterium]
MELLLIICLSVLFFAMSRKKLPVYNLILTFLFLAVSSFYAIKTLFLSQPYACLIPFHFWGNDILLTMDKLSAFFVLVINITTLVSSIYSIQYMSMYHTKSRQELVLHYFSFFTLYWSMIVLTMLQNTIAFLVVWEIMSLSSFLLVMFEAEKSLTQKAGINYFIQMHFAALFLLLGIIILHYFTDSWSWSALQQYFANYSNVGLFLVFFAGFGFKAGFVPFHTWLPHAHPAAPSHVSALMSGVMIKLGIYGILRIVFALQNDLMLIGLLVLFVSLISGITGVGVAIVQHNLKRLLAYHSIENIGIIGIGIGVGIIGLAIQNQTLAMLGFAGGILHVLNHSLFKSLLFFSAGSVYHQTHTMNIDNMGGLIKRMPVTAFIFLIASLSICGLPPFNGFISEFLIYNGFVNGIIHADVIVKLVMLFALLGLAAIGGLAIFCFTKAFGIVFLGTERSSHMHHAHEMSWWSLAPQFISLALILLIGFVPSIVLNPVLRIVQQNVSTCSTVLLPNTDALQSISLAAGVFVLIVLAVWLIKKWAFTTKKVQSSVTWGCAYHGNAPRTQYTASSYAENYIHGMEHSLNVTTHFKPIATTEYFPEHRHYKTHQESTYEKHIFKPIAKIFERFFDKFAFIQSGQTQHYILYPFVLIIVLIILTLTNLI